MFGGCTQVQKSPTIPRQSIDSTNNNKEILTMLDSIPTRDKSELIGRCEQLINIIHIQTNYMPPSRLVIFKLLALKISVPSMENLVSQDTMDKFNAIIEASDAKTQTYVDNWNTAETLTAETLTDSQGQKYEIRTIKLQCNEINTKLLQVLGTEETKSTNTLRLTGQALREKLTRGKKDGELKPLKTRTLPRIDEAEEEEKSYNDNVQEEYELNIMNFREALFEKPDDILEAK